MISLIGLDPSPGNEKPVVTLSRPITPKVICEKLTIKPFQIIADLMELNHFSSISQEIPDELLEYLGHKHGVYFEIAQ